MESEIMVIFNLAMCFAGGYVCICRMAKMSAQTTKPVIRSQYVIWFGIFAASGISWTYGEPANSIQLLMGAGVLAHLLIGLSIWRRGTPEYARLSVTDAFVNQRFNRQA